MRDKDLYAQILGIGSLWQVEAVDLRLHAGEVHIVVGLARGNTLRCPACDQACPGYDTRRRRWRHLDTCQYRTIVIAEVPRVQCAEHGVRQIVVPWAEPGSRFTALFEALVIDWLGEASVTAVARLLRLSWDAVDGVMQRAVRRGLARRQRTVVTRLGVDETSFQKRHEYVTVVVDQEAGHVLHVADDRTERSLDAFYDTLSAEQVAAIDSVAMDMWPAYIASTRTHVADADGKIAFDKFHVAKHLGDAVDRVRRQEHKVLKDQGNAALTRTRYLWLTNPEHFSAERWKEFAALRTSSLKTARAWAIKELAMTLWGYVRRGWAAKAWRSWLSWALRSRLEPVKEVARKVKKHLWGILNAIVHRVTNATTEAINATIQMLKRRACGYRNRDRFRNAIYFHLGGMDLHPTQVSMR